MVSFCNVIVIYWSTGSDMVAVVAYHTKWDLASNGLSTFAWLVFAICQLHSQGGKTIGIEAVVTNGMGVAFMGMLFLLIKVAATGRMSTQVCSFSLLGFGIAFTVCLYFSIFAPIGRDTPAARTISSCAAVIQVISQALPLLTVYSLFYPSGDAPRIKNKRKLIIFSRFSSFIISLYWSLYCSMTYQHNHFQLANNISAVLSSASLFIHLMYALKAREDPQAG